MRIWTFAERIPNTDFESSATEVFNVGAGQCPLCAVSDQNIAVRRLSAKCQQQTSRLPLGIYSAGFLYFVVTGEPMCLRYPFRKASRSALIVSACVVGMPCGKSLYVFSV